MKKVWWLLAAPLLAALAQAPGEHPHGPEGEKVHTRVAVADGERPLVLVLEEEGKELGRFTVPSPASLYPLPGGQYVLMVHREGNAVGFLYGGLALEDHGEHQDVKPENPYVAATLRTGPRPTHPSPKAPGSRSSTMGTGPWPSLTSGGLGWTSPPGSSPPGGRTTGR